MATVMKQDTVQLVKTIKERCKVCYTCIRGCPAKAISVTHGQAEIIEERCIGCGNCVRVCSQGAKTVFDSVPRARLLLQGTDKVAACLAPSFPVEFTDMDYTELCGMLRKLGCTYVIEVAAGADLVAEQYNKLIIEENRQSIIASTCPAIVFYIEKYYPDLIPHLAEIPSPMLATALLVKEIYGEDVKIIFIGPCIAKKNEAKKNFNHIQVDVVLTFRELRRLFDIEQIDRKKVSPSFFDPPHPGKGMIFPVTEGLLQSSDLVKDLIKNNIVSTAGRENFCEVIKEFATNHLATHFLDILCCDGCIMGPGFTTDQTHYSRHACVSNYVKAQIPRNNQTPVKIIDPGKMILTFTNDDHRMESPDAGTIKSILERMGKHREEDELNCGACGYETCIEHAIAIDNGLAESEMCLPYAIEKIKETARKLKISYRQLEETQNALFQSEKLASMGQLAAGIAHEINNPLGIVVLYANLIFDECDKDSELYEDMKMVVEQANRCKSIVGGLLNFARKNKILLKEADVVKLISHCLSITPFPQNVEVVFHPSSDPLCADLDSDQMMQVFINLFTNACEAMPRGGVLEVQARARDEEIEILIKDTGTGISEELVHKVFEPFFTTKQMGKGTGLGLAVAYGIIEMHHGRIRIESNVNPDRGQTGTTFIIAIPRKQENE